MRIPMATAAKTTAALTQCHEMIVHSIETEQELAADDAGSPGVLTVLVARGDTISRLSRHLATVIAGTAFTAGDVLVEEDFYEAVLEVLTDILDGDDAATHDQLLPGCIAMPGTTPISSPGRGSGVGTRRTRSPGSSTRGHRTPRHHIHVE
ncbi:hypothetical protein FXW78_46490 [Rhodococcus opacus]|nr:hypothetical protein [Rhodococcus opacus]